MTRQQAPSAPVIHAALQASTVVIDAYNAELRSPEGFAGDRASKRPFDAILDDWRERLRKAEMSTSYTINTFNREADAWQWVTEQEQAGAMCERMEKSGLHRR